MGAILRRLCRSCGVNGGMSRIVAAFGKATGKARAEADRVHQERTAGGRVRAEKQTKVEAAKWQPHQEEYLRLRASGKNHRAAQHLAFEGFIKEHKYEPSLPTMRKRLPDTEKKTS